MWLDPIQPIDTEGYSKLQEWCGPSALSLLTGEPLIQTSQHLTRIKGCTYNELEGVMDEDMIIALREHGMSVTPIDMRKWGTKCGPTLKRFIRTLDVDETVNPLLITIETGRNAHYIIHHFGLLGDNSSGRMVQPEHFGRENRLVKSAMIIRKIPQPYRG